MSETKVVLTELGKLSFFEAFPSQYLELLKEDAIVYKLLGPVLVKQDKGEAVSNVKQRSDYMESELKR